MKTFNNFIRSLPISVVLSSVLLFTVYLVALIANPAGVLAFTLGALIVVAAVRIITFWLDI